MEAFTYGNIAFAEARVDAVSGQRALGFHRLVFRIALNVFNTRGEEGAALLSDWGGEVLVQGKVGGQQCLGKLEPIGGPVLVKAYDHSHTTQVNLQVELDRKRIGALEDVRLGGDLTFSVRLWGLLRGREGPQKTVVELTEPVNQGVWVRILGELGYSRTMLLEVPVPEGSGSPEMADGVKHLAEARQAMLRGNWREAVGCCRDVLESLSLALGDADLEKQAAFKDTRAMDKNARLRLIRRALRNLCHAARHKDEITATFEWDRIDAVMMVSMLAALLQRLIEPQGS